ncbi:pectinesterase isoform X1 [Jatropha curcas]|uniref:pectinesterase isoform X1 n=1 Tax=Jatropha curcas TaxID=180498 RepID=UPI0018945262|nr:pectinesterase isoform X1 [Jatropha curcas]
MVQLHLIVFWLLGFQFLGSRGASVDANFQKECNFTRFPALCLQTLMELKDHPVHIVPALVQRTISETKLPTSFFKTQLNSQLEVQEAQHPKSVTDYCEKLIRMSLKRLDQSLLALKESPKKNKNDVQSWLSAALTFQQACKDSADSFGFPAGGLTSRISTKMDYLSELASNPLALINRVTNKAKNNIKKRRLGGEVKEFPKWVSAKDRKLLQTSTVKANAVVAKDGTGNYKTITDAIKAATGSRFVIYVKSGVYNEKIRTNKDGITLIGEGKYSTIIANDDSVAGGSSMPDTATFSKSPLLKFIKLKSISSSLHTLVPSSKTIFRISIGSVRKRTEKQELKFSSSLVCRAAITGDGFIARDIGFQNTAGPQGEQALALYIASDKSVLYRCSIAGYQDTLYALALRQFYRECDIYGTIDFIFGNAAAVFQNCYLVLRRPSSHESYNVILANGRSDPGQNTGFSIQNCRITASSDFSPVKHNFKSYLGRPWKQYSRSVIMESNIDDAISSRGWIEWPGAASYGKTLYFAEYANTGPGAQISNRVNWPGFHVIGADVAVKFTVRNFIAGTSWLPSTGVTFVSDLK